jgi:hypothetical protein
MLACERAPSLNRDSINRSIAGALAVILLVIAVERVEAPTRCMGQFDSLQDSAMRFEP